MFAVLVSVMFSGFIRMVARVCRVAVRRVRVVSGLFMTPVIVMLGRFPMMPGCVLMTLRRFGVVLRTFVFHRFLRGSKALLYNNFMTLLGMPEGVFKRNGCA